MKETFSANALNYTWGIMKIVILKTVPKLVTVHTAGRNKEHADEEILQNNSL